MFLSLILLLNLNILNILCNLNITNKSNNNKNNILSTDEIIYVFAYSWQPEFCYNEDYPGCSTPLDYWKTHFTIHGLWPQYVNGGYPASCTTESLDKSVFDKIGMDTMTTYWPNVQQEEYNDDKNQNNNNINEDYYSFWEHEWTKHGTCSNMSQLNYFNNSINLIKKFGTPSIIMNSVGLSDINTDEIRNNFGGSNMVSLQCINSIYLVGIYTCWSHDNNYNPLNQINCPNDVINEDTCTKSTVTIAAFP